MTVRALRLGDRGVEDSTLRQELSMSEKPISPLRRRMLDDMTMRRFTPDNLALARKLLDVAPPAPEPAASDPATPVTPCPCCGSAMHIIEVFKAGQRPRHRPTTMPAAKIARRELAKHPPPSHYRAVSPVQGRPQPSSSQPLSGQAREVQIGVKPLLPSVPSHVANTAPPHDHSASHVGSATSASTAPKSP
jgi:hypothetical protein